MYFKYLGELARPNLVASYGPTVKLSIPKKDGTKTVLTKADGFPVGEVIPFNFEDDFSILFLRSDPRFAEVQ